MTNRGASPHETYYKTSITHNLIPILCMPSLRNRKSDDPPRSSSRNRQTLNEGNSTLSTANNTILETLKTRTDFAKTLKDRKADDILRTSSRFRQNPNEGSLMLSTNNTMLEKLVTKQDSVVSVINRKFDDPMRSSSRPRQTPLEGISMLSSGNNTILDRTIIRHASVESLRDRKVDDLLRSSSKYRQTPNESSSILSPIKNAMLEKLRNRQEAVEEIPITPELAAKVVKQFILPMFEADSRRLLHSVRSDTFGLNQSLKLNDMKNNSGEMKGIASTGNLATIANTVYAELKLSEHLDYDMQKIRNELSQTLKKLKDAEQQRESISKEYESLKSDHVSKCEELRLMNYDYAILTSELQKLEAKQSFYINQVNTSKNLYNETLKENERLSSEMQSSRSMIDIRYI
jgi:hypothetical protein